MADPEPASGPKSAPELPPQWRPDEGFQKINVKLLLDAPPRLDTDFLLEIFGRWRLEEGDDIVDLADYAHVDEGPGCLLISHRWHFGIDFSEGKPGLFYSTRKGLTGSPEEKLATAVRGLFGKSIRLLGESEFPRSVRPRCGEIELVLNDRVLTPNLEGSDAEWRPALARLVERLYGPVGAHIERDEKPTRRLGYRVRAREASALTLESLAGRLG